MLLSRLLGWIKGHKTFHIFLLEVLAVFIGITGSLFIDRWREQQADYEQLDRELRNLHWVLQRQVSNQSAANPVIVSALQSAVLLGFGDLDERSDEEILDHYWRATTLPGSYDEQPSFESTNENLSIPYNDTVAMIEEHLREVRSSSAFFDSMNSVLGEQVAHIHERSGIVGGWSGAGGLADQDLANFARQLDAVTGEFGKNSVADGQNLARIREVVMDPDIRARFQRLIGTYNVVGKSHLTNMQMKRSAIAAIMRYAPGITIPFVEVGIDGSATPYGWQTYLPMVQDQGDAAVWRVVLDLVDGEVKFRADDAWAVNWGTAEFNPEIPCDETRTDECDSWSFQGDISKAFPTGKALLNGDNIPVRAGRYEVTFNTETLDYTFRPVSDAD